jgi:hypothetical protein
MTKEYDHIAHLTGSSGPGAGPIVENDDREDMGDDLSKSLLKEVDVSDADDGDDGQVVDSGEAPEGYVSKDEFDRIKREADGRLSEIVALRQGQSSLASNMEALRQDLLEREVAGDDDAVDLPSEIADHPSMGYIKKRMDRMEDNLRGALELTPEEVQVKNQEVMVNQVNQYVATKRAEFEKTHPDFEAAYQHAREARKKFLVGVPEHEKDNVLAYEEMSLAVRAMQQGKNPAEEVYQVATDFGYKKNGTTAKSDPAKVKAGVESAGVSNVAGGRSSRSGKMSAATFFANLSKQERLALLASPEKFEEIARTGKISVD